MNATQDSLRAIAFYLPQFHPIPENNKWWGKGFTEWTNVAKAKPLFKGHYQPHLPADLGFYDLRLPEARQAQADLAQEYGINGFCYYHYWFNARRILDRPFNEVLKSGTPGFPFCLCWANENWTRAWDGRSGEVLLEQHYNDEDDFAHINWLVQAFRDSRYIRVDDKPLFLVYRSSNMPDPLRTTSIWREESLKQGIGDIFLCRVESLSQERNIHPNDHGFDAAVDFQPDWSNMGKALRKSFGWKVLQRLGISDRSFLKNAIYDYEAYIESMLDRSEPEYLRFPCVTPIWDNSARRCIDAVILKNALPDVYEVWFRRLIEKHSSSHQHNLIFINAWNEWGEGCHLEPDQKHGRAYLEATKRAMRF